MKLPRDLHGEQLVKSLRALGYMVTRQKGSHIRVTTTRGSEHHEVIPCHKPIKPGTLASIHKNVAEHHKISTQELVRFLEL